MPLASPFEVECPGDIMKVILAKPRGSRAVEQEARQRARFSDVIGPETRDICYATQNRQASVRELCEVADVILVVGSHNSSNTIRLLEIAALQGRRGLSHRIRQGY